MYLLAGQAFDYLSLALQVVTLVVTFGGLWFVVASLRQASEQQRVEAGPYVRVDLGGPLEDMPDFSKPAEHFHTDEQIVDLDKGAEASVVLSAWFRNYQPHALGVAFGVTAIFSIDSETDAALVNEVRIAYLEHNKPVLVDIVRCARDRVVQVTLLSLTFFDFYDRRHEHTYGEKGTNALHGRLSVLFDNGRLDAVPEGRSRGTGVDFGGDPS